MSKSLNRQTYFHVVYMKIAMQIATLSRAERRKVGAILVKDDNIISFGYNGTPAGFSNKCEDGDGCTLPYVLHAEANAIVKATKNTYSIVGSTLYLTFSPCYNCSKLILQAGITRVIYLDLHSNTDGLKLLRQGGVQVIKLNL